MRLCAVKYSDIWRTGVVDPMTGEHVFVYPMTIGTVDDVIGAGQISPDVVPLARIPLSEAELGAPIQRWNKNVLCVGWNYWDHFEESKGKREGQDPNGRPSHPTFFTKSPLTVIGPHDEIKYDAALSEQWDYEAEIAIVIGSSGKNISRADALDHVFGLTLANDVSLRDTQRAHGGQWFKGKSIDGTMPLGPWITTRDEIENLEEVRIECLLNGEVMQDAYVGQMAFSLPALIEELSQGMTLDVGDVILTGTPSGIGNAREPQVFLKPGDIVITRATGLGALHNRIC